MRSVETRFEQLRRNLILKRCTEISTRSSTAVETSPMHAVRCMCEVAELESRDILRSGKSVKNS
jgi:hypothetical protein